MRFFVPFLLIFVLLPLRSLAQMASSVTSVPAAPVLVVPRETTGAPKGEYIEWRRGYVSGVSDRIITVVVSTAQRRGSYEPVEITPTTKITRSGRPATLKEIRIRQYAGVRGYRQGDIVKATEYAIGGLPYARPVRRARVLRKAKSTPKRTTSVLKSTTSAKKKKAPVKGKSSRIQQKGKR